MISWTDLDKFADAIFAITAPHYIIKFGQIIYNE